jgi:hypothetical protein
MIVAERPQPRVLGPVILVGALALACACSGGAPRPAATDGGPAPENAQTQGPTRPTVRAVLAAAPPWYLHLTRPAGGTVSSADGLVACGVGGSACGDAQGWTEIPASQGPVTLTATADTAHGWSFVQWVGDCDGATPTCTVSSGANRSVAAMFRSATAVAGPSRVGSVYGVSVYRPTGGNVISDDGQILCGTRGTACSAFYAWNVTAVLQAIPDPGYGFATWAGDCQLESCRLSTMPYGSDKYVLAIIPPLGSVGHGNYTAQSLHGPAYLDFLGGRPGARLCSNAACHGATLNGAGIAPSCHTCHAQAGWTGWQSNCSFCHGTRSAQTMAGYALAAYPTWSAPPDAVAQRLDPARAAVPSRTGAHQAHLIGATAQGLRIAQPFSCSTCHPVPTDLGHVGGSLSRATVALTGAGQGSLPAALGSYDPVTGTCATACHGASPSPAWSATGLQCNGCHGLPPAVSTGHPDVPADLPGCRGCHPDTVLPDGSIDVAGGRHLDGVVEASGGHADYSSPAIHGPRFFEALRADGASSCRGCHGSTFGGGMGPSCDDCHARAGWTVSWQTNCSFCHGVRSAATMTVAYDPALLPTLSAPPDALSQRLTGTPDPARTGAHTAHLAGRGTNGGAWAPALACATCHAVPTDLAHAGGPGVAPVTLTGSGTRPAGLGSYAPATGSCATYCHGSYAGTYTWESYDWGTDSMIVNSFAFQGSGATPGWSGGPMTCGSCHGNPPRGGVWHSGSHGNATANNECQLCHPDASSVNAVGQAITNPALHVDGLVQVAPRWSSRCFGCH